FAACQVNPSHWQMVDRLRESRYWGLWSLRLGFLDARLDSDAVFADRHLKGITVLGPAYQAIFERLFCFLVFSQCRDNPPDGRSRILEHGRRGCIQRGRPSLANRSK